MPLAVQGPGFDGGGQLRELVSLIDVPPTLLDAAGLPVPPEMQGRSIVPLTHGDRNDWPAEVFIQISESQVGRAIRTDRWKYSVSAPDRDAWNDSGSDRYVEEFLYDLAADPHELTNLAGLEAFRDLAAELRERLIGRMVAAGEAAPTIEAAPHQPGRERGLNPGDYLKRADVTMKSPHLP